MKRMILISKSLNSIMNEGTFSASKAPKWVKVVIADLRAFFSGGVGNGKVAMCSMPIVYTGLSKGSLSVI